MGDLQKSRIDQVEVSSSSSYSSCLSACNNHIHIHLVYYQSVQHTVYEYYYDKHALAPTVTGSGPVEEVQLTCARTFYLHPHSPARGLEYIWNKEWKWIRMV